MYLANVIGNIVATQKDPGLTGGKLLIVQQVSVELKPTNSFAVAVDAVGAGVGELVLVATGSSARFTGPTKDKPVDAVIMAIIDSVEMGEKVIWSKGE